MSSESDYVTLISSDGYSFVVQRSSACISGAIKRMLDPSRASTFCSPSSVARYNGQAVSHANRFRKIAMN